VFEETYMRPDKSDVALVVTQFVLLLGVVAFVDRPLVRVGLGFVIGLLLLQRALGLTAPKDEVDRLSDRRQDQTTRDGISRLLVKIREFYTACHLVQSDQISPAEARERTARIERELNQLLAEVVQTSQAEVPPVETGP
jgi:divalent metal cation (Fe/Co/Zn/Cd) transporter